MTDRLMAERYLRKAERALDEARLLLRETSTEGACSRAYYARCTMQPMLRYSLSVRKRHKR